MDYNSGQQRQRESNRPLNGRGRSPPFPTQTPPRPRQISISDGSDRKQSRGRNRDPQPYDTPSQRTMNMNDEYEAPVPRRGRPNEDVDRSQYIDRREYMNQQPSVSPRRRRPSPSPPPPMPQPRYSDQLAPVVVTKRPAPYGKLLADVDNSGDKKTGIKLDLHAYVALSARLRGDIAIGLYL